MAQEKLNDQTTNLNNILRSLADLQTEKQALLANLQAQDNLSQQLGQDFATIRGGYQILDQQKDNTIRSVHDLQAEINNLRTQHQQQVNQLQTTIAGLTIQRDRANNTISQTQNHLGITDLTNLPTLPTGKTLSDLIIFFNNPPNCLNPQHADYDTVKQERDNYQSQLASHVCPTCPQTCCVNGDYDSIKSQLVIKGQKITELEAEIRKLKNKPPVSSVSINNPQTGEPLGKNKELNDERDNLLMKINQQANEIDNLKEQLTKSQTKSCQKCKENENVLSQTTHKNVPVLVKETCVGCLIGYGIITLAFFSFVIRIIKGKRTKKIT